MPYSQTPPRGLTTIIALMTMIGPFTIDTYLPSFPDIEATYGVSRSLLSQSLGIYLAAFAFSTLAFGPLTDRFGRRVIIIFSLSLYILASVGCAMANNYSDFILYRIIQGVAAAGGLVAGRAIIRDVFSPQDAHYAMSRIMMLFAIAPAIAPVIGGWLHDLYGWHSVFYFLAGYASIILLASLFLIPETLEQSHRQSLHPVKVTRVYINSLKNQRFMFLILVVTCYFSGLFLYIASAPTIIFNFLHLDVGDFSFMFFPLVGGLIIGAWLSGRLSRRWEMQRTIKLALTLMLIGSMLNMLQALWLPPMIITSFTPLMIYTCGIGIAMPAMTILALDCFPKNRGTASALQGFFQMIGNALVASLAAPFLSLHPGHLAFGQLILLAGALFLWWRLSLIKVKPAL